MDKTYPYLDQNRTLDKKDNGNPDQNKVHLVVLCFKIKSRKYRRKFNCFYSDCLLLIMWNLKGDLVILDLLHINTRTIQNL